MAYLAEDLCGTFLFVESNTRRRILAEEVIDITTSCTAPRGRVVIFFAHTSDGAVWVVVGSHSGSSWVYSPQRSVKDIATGHLSKPLSSGETDTYAGSFGGFLRRNGITQDVFVDAIRLHAPDPIDPTLKNDAIRIAAH